MRCRTCDYPLWNLPARKCPECGTAFKPSDFHFLHNAVRFCCPHCEQSYYGTGEHGHLIPAEFNCVTCGRHITMDQCVLQPAEGVKEEQAQTDIMPWLERKRRGWISGWFKTVGMAMVMPQKLMRAIPPKAGTGDAWFFIFITHTLVYGLGIALPFGVIGLFMLARGDPDAIYFILMSAAWAIGGAVVTMGIAGLWALTAHGLLRITGGCAHGLGRTVQAIMYSCGAHAPLGIPCIGPYCGIWLLWIWWLISAIVMTVEGQRVRGLRATLCVSVFPLLIVGAVLAMYFAIVYFAVTQARTVSIAQMQAMGYQPTSEASTIGAALSDYATQHGGQFPPHALQLAADGSLMASDFMVWQVGHDETKVPVGTTTLTAFQMLGPNRAQLAAQDAASALPASVVAHRLGDVVFTYHGVNANSADPQLWIAIVHADPDQQSTGSMTPVAVCVDGSLSPLPPQTMNTLMSQQNALRAQYGLPALPDPATVRHAQPATGQ